MKKFLAILSISFLMFITTSAAYHHYGYSVKCAKCIEEYKKWPGSYINIAWRTSEPYKVIDGKVFALYHCYGGHYYWAEIN